MAWAGLTPGVICAGNNLSSVQVKSAVTGQNIPPAGLYPGLKRPRLDYAKFL